MRDMAGISEKNASHIKHVADILALEFNLQRIAVISFTAADVAFYVNVRKKMHLYALDSVALAGFAPAA